MNRTTISDLRADDRARYRGAMATRDTAAVAGSSLRWFGRSREVVSDLALWVLVCAPLFISPFIETPEIGLGDVLVAVGALALILVRRRWPRSVLVVGLVAVVAVTAIIDRPTALIPAIVVLLFNVAVRSDRTTSVRAGIAGTGVMLWCIGILASNDFFGPEFLAGVAWPALAVAGGEAVRNHREAIDAAEERAARAEATREEEARRRVAEERLHIARELHDVIAHRIAVINVQSGVAAHLARTNPDGAEQALAIVRSSARQVLDELADVLDVLRADDETASTDPTPTIGDIPTLIASFDDVGLDVEFDLIGDMPAVGDAVGVVLYRTVQEALTNAHKHGQGHARVVLRQNPDAVELCVSNAVSGAAGPSSSGFGLIGMRERVHAVGGDLTVGPHPDGTFVVDARFPHHRSREAT
jgi:signal transduction histidine kinase